MPRGSPTSGAPRSASSSAPVPPTPSREATPRGVVRAGETVIRLSGKRWEITKGRAIVARPRAPSGPGWPSPVPPERRRRPGPRRRGRPGAWRFPGSRPRAAGPAGPGRGPGDLGPAPRGPRAAPPQGAAAVRPLLHHEVAGLLPAADELAAAGPADVLGRALHRSWPLVPL